MFSRTLSLLWFAATLNVTAALAQTAAAPAPAPTSGAIRISIKNEYEAELKFGPLGKGWRKGTDRVEGILNRQGRDYTGIVQGVVSSEQQITGLIGNCGPKHYEDSQKLRVISHSETGFNDDVQTVTPATIATQASYEFLRLEFTPETMTTLQPGPRLPPRTEQDPFLDDLVISCHTLIDTPSGIAFLPLNDSRWTTEGVGYIIAVPRSGVLNYTDTTVPATGMTLGPFDAKKSIWTIEVERLR